MSNAFPSGYKRLVVSTMPTMIIVDDGTKKVLLGYNGRWEEFDPIGGSYMMEVPDLEKIAKTFPSTCLEIKKRDFEPMRDEVSAVAEKEGKYWVNLNELLGADVSYPTVNLLGDENKQILDAQFLVSEFEIDKLVTAFVKREYGIGPDISQAQELYEELGFQVRGCYGIATPDIVRRGMVVTEAGEVIRKSMSKSLGVETTYVDFRPQVSFSGDLHDLVLAHAKFTRKLDDPNHRIILATKAEIDQGYVMDHIGWKIPQNNAIDNQQL
jgi:hypothetical protein